MSRLFCFGLGYSAQALAHRLRARDWIAQGTATTAETAAHGAALGFETFVFDGLTPGSGVREALAIATHVLISVPPGETGDPVAQHHADDLRGASQLTWIGYLSTIGVYGDRGGAWVDETDTPRPSSERSRRRLMAEEAWRAFGRETGVRVTVFRLSGIYGPGRGVLDALRDGTARRIVKPGQVFNRIHVTDIAGAVEADVRFGTTSAVYNVTDDEPAPPQDVIAYAAELLGLSPPPEIPFAEANLSLMGQSFYSENKRVANAAIKQALGFTFVYPTYREGLQSLVERRSS